MTTETVKYLTEADTTQLDRLKRKNDELNDSTQKSTGRTAEQQAAMDGTARKAGFLALGIAGLGVAAFKMSADYDKAMNVFQATTNASEKAMERARKKAVELGNDAGLPAVSARDAAEAMNELAKGGFNAAESIDAARGVLLLGQAAETDFKESTTIVARSLKAFGGDAKDATRYVDILAAASLKSTVSINDIADGMRYAGVSAQTVGVGFKESATALALLNDEGLVGTTAGTALNQMFVKMKPATLKASNAMMDLNLWTKRADGTFGSAFFDAEGKFVGIRKATELWGEATKNLSQEQKLEARNTIFGANAAKAAGKLLEGGTKNWDNYAKAVGQTGMAQKLASARAKGSAGAIEQLRNSLETAAIVFGGTIAPAIVAVLRPLTSFMNLLSGHTTMVTALIGVIGALAATMWILNSALKVYRTIKLLAKAYKLGVLWTKIQAAVNYLLGTSFYAALGPIGLIILAIVALVAIFVIAYKKSETFRKIVDGALSYVADSAKRMWETMKVAFDALIGAFEWALNWVRDNWPLIVGLMLGPLGLIIAAISTDAFGIRTKLIEGLQGILDWVTNQFSRMYELGLEFIGKMKQGIIDGVAGIGGTVWDQVNNIWTVISGYYANVRNWGLSVGGWIKDAAVDGLVGIGNAAWNLVNNIWEVISGAVASVKHWGRSVGSWIKEAMVDGITGIGNTAWNYVNNIWEVVSGALKTIKSWGKSIGTWLLTGLIDGIRKTAGKVITAIKKYVTDKVPGFMQKIWESRSPSALMAQHGRWLMEGLAQGIASAGGQAVAAAAQQAKAISDAATVQGTVLGARPALASVATGGTAPLVHIENVYATEEEDARRLGAKLSATLAVRAA